MMRLLSGIVAMAGLVAGLLAALFLGESIWVGFFASDEHVAEYHFGTESMIAHGGPVYSSWTTYVTSGLFEGAVLAIFAITCLLFSVRLWRMPNKPLHPTPDDGARR